MIFTKMQCVGFDVLVLNCFDNIIEIDDTLPAKVCDRHFGVGADGMALVLYSDNADVKVQFFNSDGIESPCNTNVLICIAKYAYDNKLANKDIISIETINGVKYIKVSDDYKNKFIANIGEPIITSQLIPVDYNGDDFIEKSISVGADDYTVSCVSVASNPCTVVFTKTTEELNEVEINKIAPYIEKHNIFPNNTNVIFCNIVDRNTIQIRCWKINTGEVIGCDFGCVAAFVISNLLGKVDDTVSAELYGGDLTLEISDDNFVYVTSEAEVVFELNW